MSSVASEGPTTTSTLLPSVTRLVESRLELGPVSVILATLIVLVLSLLTVGCNSIILAAFYRYKRLRTASNCLLVSLAISDFGVGVFMPFGTYLELSESPGGNNIGGTVVGLCVMPYCILIVLCSVSVLVTVAIAVDRLTSLAQPLRYKNIITHSSIEKYIAVFWIYAIAVGLSPLIYAKLAGANQAYSGSCRFNGVIMPPVRVFLFLAVWAPSALILLGCYVYVYLVARAHARAIYTVELSFRNQTQTLALPRYGQTLAVTVGAFFILWLPFQTCMLLDVFCGTNILSDCTIWLGLPIMAHSGTNPWIYAFHHGEMRIAAGKIAEDLVSLFGVTPSRYGCSPARRGSNTNLELAEVVNSNEERRPPVEDCFAAAKHHTIVYASKRCLEMSSKTCDISPENANRSSSSDTLKQSDIVEENIHDLTKMLDPKYIVYRNHVIDSNHNVDKIRNLKYMLDPTFNKIRHLRRLNHKKIAGKNISRFHDSRFVSYQYLKTEGPFSRKTTMHLNTMSDPMLNTDSPITEGRTFHEVICHQSQLCKRKASSVSDSNLKDTVSQSDVNLRQNRNSVDSHRCSVHLLDNNKYMELSRNVVQQQHVEHHRRSFSWARARQRFNAKYLESPSPTLDLRFQQTSYASLPTPDGTRSYSSKGSPKQKQMIHITTNRLASLIHHRDQSTARPININPHRNFDILRHSESITTLPGPIRLLEPSRMLDTLAVPTIHSEPPSPIDPLPLDSLQEENTSKSTVLNEISSSPPSGNLKSPARHSDPVIPSVLLNIEDCSSRQPSPDNLWCSSSPTQPSSGPVSPQELTDLLLREKSRDQFGRFTDCTIFPEHDSTRFSSRRPSDSRWSESSRSQEVLSNVTEHPRFPSSYSVNNFQSNDLADEMTSSCLDPFMCSDALSSSLRESFFSAPSMPDSEDIFTSFETDEQPMPTSPKRSQYRPVKGKTSISTVNLVKRPTLLQNELQCKSTESMFRSRDQNERLCAILRLEPSIHRSRPRVRPVICKNSRLAPLATPTPTDVCTPTFDITVVGDIKSESALGVRV